MRSSRTLIRCTARYLTCPCTDHKVVRVLSPAVFAGVAFRLWYPHTYEAVLDTLERATGIERPSSDVAMEKIQQGSRQATEAARAYYYRRLQERQARRSHEETTLPQIEPLPAPVAVPAQAETPAVAEVEAAEPVLAATTSTEAMAEKVEVPEAVAAVGPSLEVPVAAEAETESETAAMAVPAPPAPAKEEDDMLNMYTIRSTDIGLPKPAPPS